MARSPFKEIESILAASGAKEVRKIDPRRVPTAQWVRMKCQYGCGGYGQCLTCPPYSPTPEQTRRMLDEYRAAFLIHWGRKSGGRKALAEIERQVFLKGYYKAFTMASGPCGLCRKCNLEGPCRQPYLARPSMEACGIDVYQTARQAGFPIRVVTCYEDVPNYYSLLLVE